MTQTNPIAEAVEPRRTAAVDRAAEAARAYVDRCIAELEAKGWDLNAVAPRARSTMSRRDYQIAQGKRAGFRAITKTTAPRPDDVAAYDYRKEAARENGTIPDVVVLDPKGVQDFILARRLEADLQFSSYISKLTGKVNDGATSAVTAAELDSGALWSFSHLTVTRADATVERWRTQMILNVSVLGKLFNQWPTRRVK